VCSLQIKEILRQAPRKRQTMLFSATMTEEVKSLASLSLQHPVRLAANVKPAAPRQLRQEIVRIKVCLSPKLQNALDTYMSFLLVRHTHELWARTIYLYTKFICVSVLLHTNLRLLNDLNKCL
jgi:hypothetical protein